MSEQQKFLVIENEGRIFSETEHALQFMYYREDGEVLTTKDKEDITDFYLRYSMYQMEQGNPEKAPAMVRLGSCISNDGKSMLLNVEPLNVKFEEGDECTCITITLSAKETKVPESIGKKLKKLFKFGG